MKTQIRSLLTLVCAVSASLIITGPRAQAGYVVTLQQVGANVVATGSGPIDLTGLTFAITAAFSPGITPNGAFILTSPQPPVSEDSYHISFSGPMSFGSGGATAESSGSGAAVGFGGSVSDLLYVPAGYVSGNPLSDSATYNNQTLSNLGVTPGTYEWTWGAGPNQNFTLLAVPEPFASSLVVLGLIALFGARRLRSLHSA